MSTDSGYILLYGSAFNNKIIQPKKPFSRFEAWTWMLMEACRLEEGRKDFKDFGGKERQVFEPYGGFCHSLRFMASAWGWKKKRTETFLKHLENDLMISVNRDQQITQITICNFESYQRRKKAKGGSKGTARGQQGDSKGTNYNTLSRKHVNNKNTSPPKFSPDSVEYKLTENAIEYIQMRWPKVKFSSTQIQGFCKMFEKAIRIDGYKPAEIDQIMQWVSEDNSPNGTNFCWADQWRSPMKLRQKDKQGMKYIDKWNELRKRSLYENGVYKEGAFE